MGGQLVGKLDAADRRSLRFTYHPDYAAGPASTPLSVSMPLRVSPYLHATVHPYLWGLLPGNDRVLERWAREFGCSPTDVAGLLRGVGGDVAGAAQYVVPEATPEESLPGEVEWLGDDDVARFLRDLRREHDDVASAARRTMEPCGRASKDRSPLRPVTLQMGNSFRCNADHSHREARDRRAR